MSDLLGRGSGRPFQPGQSGNPGGRLVRSSADIARGVGAKVLRAMVKALFVPDAPFTSAGIANANDIWCRCEGTVTETLVLNPRGRGANRWEGLLHASALEAMGVAPTVEDRPAEMLLPGFDALPVLDGKLPGLPDEAMPIPDTATLRAVLLRYLPFAQAVIVRGATAPGTETTTVGVAARRILLDRGYGKLATQIEIDGPDRGVGAMHLAAVMAKRDATAIPARSIPAAAVVVPAPDETL
jgi:hypothetical protein